MSSASHPMFSVSVVRAVLAVGVCVLLAPPVSAGKGPAHTGASCGAANCHAQSAPVAQDIDGDGIGDAADNCTFRRNNDQRDTDGDGFGNLCDPDFDNNGIVGRPDFQFLRDAIGTDDEDADLNGDGIVNGVDYFLFRPLAGGPPGPGIGALVTEPVGEQPRVQLGYRVLAANDLGMHCADLDTQIMSILPPFNVIHAQLIERGSGPLLPRLVTPGPGDDIDIVYSAASSPTDPALASTPAPSLLGTPRAEVSINSTSRNDPAIPDEVFKGNFWEINPETGNTYGFDAYRSLYPDDALALFEPLPGDLGLPVPDPAALPDLDVGQQAMPSAVQHNPLVIEPYLANAPQSFDRFDTDLPFFVDFPFGALVEDVNWWAADGLPMMPVDDAGRDNAYPLLRVQAVMQGAPVATLDIVVPVASEADCQVCHVDPIDCADPRLPPELINLECQGVAIAPTEYTNTDFEVASLDDAPGDTIVQQLLNAAKLNILRLHDAKHGADYTDAAGGAAVCDTAEPGDPDCLEAQTPVQCARCHYTPALDLAQAGPIDEPGVGPLGRQQTRHISMSRAMHGHHGSFDGLFPAMPPPIDDVGVRRSPQLAQDILDETCYGCHPGKRTQCLRGAMFGGGMVCQDCHGDMTQVGNDFSEAFADTPFPDGADLDKRIPWASEPGCQSCHTGDAVTTIAGSPGTLAAPDGIRLLQAWRSDDPDALPIEAPSSRFAEDASLYRLGKGHGGIMCEGCHGSTHAVWPVANPNANDNLTARQLQGHAGALTECSSCHAITENGLPIGLGGPHGMHPVADWNGPDHRWNDEHKEVFAQLGPGACRGCHGLNGQGTALSRTATDRRLECKNEDGLLCGPDQEFILVPAGTTIGCGDCHSNEIQGGQLADRR